MRDSGSLPFSASEFKPDIIATKQLALTTLLGIRIAARQEKQGLRMSKWFITAWEIDWRLAN